MKKKSPLSFLKRSNKKTIPKLVSGFTLVELLVTISIFVIITGVVLFNSKNFDNTVLLRDFTYDVALTIKQAQSYGVNVKESSLSTFDSSYGVYFDLNQIATNFVLFNDLGNGIGGDPDKIYNNIDSVKSCPIDNPECIQKYSMKNGTHIQSVCAGSDETDCDGLGATNRLSILFQRPRLNALIYKIKDDGQISTAQSYAKIILSSVDGITSTVVITSEGQIYVKK